MRAFILLLSLGSIPVLPGLLGAQSSAEIDDLVRQTMKTWRLPGLSIVVVQGDKILYLKGFGVREFGKPEAVTPDTVFPIASCTKSFTTLAMGMLVDEGKMKWDDPVRKHVPYFRLSDPLADASVTLRDLVCHRTGVAAHDLLWYAGGWNLEDRIKHACKLDLDQPFRASFRYQVIFFEAAGAAVDIEAAPTDVEAAAATDVEATTAADVEATAAADVEATAADVETTTTDVEAAATTTDVEATAADVEAAATTDVEATTAADIKAATAAAQSAEAAAESAGAPDVALYALDGADAAADVEAAATDVETTTTDIEAAAAANVEATADVETAAATDVEAATRVKAAAGVETAAAIEAAAGIKATTGVESAAAVEAAA